MLAAGGDCVDAVVATTFALGVLEPWMSGVGGGGAMVLYRAHEDRYEVIDYGMRAPESLRPEDYPLTGHGAASDIFPWPRVKDDRNLHGQARSRCPAWLRAWRKRIAATQECRGRNCWPERRARRQGPSGGLVDHADDRQRRRGSAALPVSAAAYLTTACRLIRMGHQERRAAAAGPAQGDVGAVGGTGPRDFYKGDMPTASLPMFRPPAARSGSRTSRRSALLFASPWNTLSRRRGLCDAGANLRTDLAHALRLLQTDLQPGRPTGRIRLRGLCAGAAIGLSRAPARRWATPTAGARWAPSIWRRLHHAFFGGRP